MGSQSQEPDPELAATEVRSSEPRASDSGSDPTHLKTPTPDGAGGLLPPLPLPLVAEEHYRVGVEVARGGLGKVLRAFDQRLGREVALKVLRVRKPDAEARFLREAMITARLQHPGIVPVYEAGVWPDGEPFYAMKLVSGKALSELISERAGLDERLALLASVIDVADAMAFAHENKVIHRDLKPQNVMVGAFGETLVIDWGLAKSLELGEGGASVRAETPQVESGETMAGSVLGTPGYMPPEQARGEKVDARADVYALGAVLYHLLRGQMPFSGLSPGEALQRVMLGPPPDIATVASGVPEDLAAIVRKAMAGRPEDRYPSARELAADLRRFQTGQLVSVRQYRTVEVLRRWVLRHRAAFAVAAGALVLLALAGAVAVARVVDERNLALEKRREAEAARAEATFQRDALMLVQARTALERDPTAALAWARQHPGGEALAQLRTIASDAVSRGVASHVFRSHLGRVTGLACGATADALFSSGADGRLARYDLKRGGVEDLLAPQGVLWQTVRLPGSDALATIPAEGHVLVVTPGAPARTLHVDDPPVLTLAVSADGTQLAAGTVKGRLWLFDVATGARRELPAHPQEIRALAFSADGRRLASASFDGAVHLVTLESGALREAPVRDPELYTIALSPDGRLLASAGKKGVVHLWDENAQPVKDLAGHDGVLTHLVFAPGGRALASASRDRTVRVWALPSGEARVLEGHTAEVLRLAWSPDGAFLASGSGDATVRLWDPGTGESQLFAGHQAFVSALAFSEDGRRLASAAQDGSVRVWPVKAPPRVAGADGTVRFSTDGSAIVGLAGDERLVALRPGALPKEPIAQSSSWHYLDFVDAQRAVAVDADKAVHLLDLASSEHRVLTGLQAVVGSAALAQGWLAGGAWDGTLRVWKLGAADARALPAHKTYTLATVASPDGRLVATGGDEGGVRLWEVGAWTSRALPSLSGPVHTLRFSPDGRYAAAGDIHGELRVWDVAAGRPVLEVRDKGHVRAVAFSPDAAWLASSGDDKVVHLRRLGTSEARVLEGPEQSVLDLDFSPDGALLAVGSADGAVRVYELATDVPRLLRGHRGQVEQVLFADQGQLLLSADTRGGVRRWTRADFAPLPADRAGLEAWMRAASTAQIDLQHQPTTRAGAAVGGQALSPGSSR